MMGDSAPGQVDQPQDIGLTPAAVVSRWTSELDLSNREQERWLKIVGRIEKRYAEEDRERNEETTAKRRFPILWSNMQTLQPAIYARSPTAVVGRRFKDADPVARQASEVLERSINSTLDQQAFATTMKACRDDYLLAGRGLPWLRYVPTMRTVQPHLPVFPAGGDEDPHHIDAAGQRQDPEAVQVDEQGPYVLGEPYEEVEFEEVVIDHVANEDWGTNKARTWAEVRFVWRRSFLTRDELKKRFTKPAGPDGRTIGEVLTLDYSPPDADANGGDFLKKAAIYEIWDKASRSVVWISRSYGAEPLDERPDPLGLRDFFPCPRPLLGTTTTKTLIPTPDYEYYRDQARELDELTERIGVLTESLKVRGFYAGHHENKLAQAFSATSGVLIPVDSWAALKDDGGVKGLIEWFPVEQVIQVLKGCIDTRKQLIEDVHEITGIADIMRGESDPRETAQAQTLKGNWGSLRLRDRIREMERLARDVMQIAAEIIAAKFGVDTLKAITDLDMPDASVMPPPPAPPGPAMSPQPGAPPAPAPPPAPAAPPTGPVQPLTVGWDQVVQLLHDPGLRRFRIDVETDSTTEPNEQQEKDGRVAFISAVGKYLAESLPVVQAAPQMLPVVLEGLKYLVRGFRVGREMEDVIDKAADALQQAAAAPKPPPAPTPKDQADMMRAQADQANAQAAGARVQVDAMKVQSDHAQGMAQVQAENVRTAADMHMAERDIVAQGVQRAQERMIQREVTPGPLLPSH